MAATEEGGHPWYLRRDVQCEVAAPLAVLRRLGVYSGSFVEASSIIPLKPVAERAHVFVAPHGSDRKQCYMRVLRSAGAL